MGSAAAKCSFGRVVNGMWDAIKAAIQSNGTTVRFIAIIIVLAIAAWFMRTVH